MSMYSATLNDGIIDSVKNGAMSMFNNVMQGGNIENAGNEALQRFNEDVYEEANSYVNNFDANDAMDVVKTGIEEFSQDALQKTNGNGGINPSSNEGYNAKPDTTDLDAGGFIKRNLAVRPVPVAVGVAVGGYTYYKTKSVARTAIFSLLSFMGANFVQDRIQQQ